MSSMCGYFKSLIVLTLLTYYLPFAFGNSHNAALFSNDLTDFGNMLTDSLSCELINVGYTVKKLDINDLCDTEQLNLSNFDLLILPDSGSLPVKSITTIRSFLKEGGDIIALRSPLWENVFTEINGQQFTYEKYQIEKSGLLSENILLDFNRSDLQHWSRTGNNVHMPFSYEALQGESIPGGRALRILIHRFANFSQEYMISPQILKKPPQDHSLLIFSAKGREDTPSVVVNCIDVNNISWSKEVPLYSQWRKYIFAQDDFDGPEGKQFKLKDIQQIQIGFDVWKTGASNESSECWISRICTAKISPEYENILSICIDSLKMPLLDTLSPSYKLFESHEVSTLYSRFDQAIISQDLSYEAPLVVYSPHFRAKGSGFDKGRMWRWIPLVEGKSENDQWRGTPITLLVNFDGQYKGGIWASFGIQDKDWYSNQTVLHTIGQIAARMKNGVFIADGGASFYTYFENQEIKLGVRVANLGKKDKKKLKTRISLVNNDNGQKTFEKVRSIDINSLDIQVSSDVWKPKSWPENGFKVLAEIVDGNETIDQVEHEINVWTPKKKKQFITVKNGDFEYKGKRWRPNGVNYMPSSGIAIEDGDYFESWFSKRAYDPEVIERDLRNIKGMGLNAVSFFIHYKELESQNLLDFLRRLEKHNLPANLALRTPSDHSEIKFDWEEKNEKIVEYYRLWEHDIIFAYDIGWEKLLDPHGGLKEWDSEWVRWLKDRYGSIENAEKDWNYSAVRDEFSNVTTLKFKHLHKKGDWFRMTAAYRRFLDTLLYKKYTNFVNQVKSVDSNHLVSFRMYEVASPTYHWDKYMLYQLSYLAAAVDIIEPEAYGRVGNWDLINGGRFMYEYYRWINPDMPVFWAETGNNIWSRGRADVPTRLLQFQANYYRDVYLMLIDSGFDGVFHWYYPGGYRCDEKSDYGIINPDGTDRPVTKVIREYSQKFINGPNAKPVDHWIEIDRDAHPDTTLGIYEVVKDEFWKAIYFGQIPGFRTAGTGTDSTNCPMIAVGNTPCNGNNPPKYLDAVFDSFEVLNVESKWEVAENGDAVKVNANDPVIARIKLRNLGEAKWIAPKADENGLNSSGKVYVIAESQIIVSKTALPSNVAHLSSVEIMEVKIAPRGLEKTTEISITLEAEGRTKFGEKYTINAIP